LAGTGCVNSSYGKTMKGASLLACLMLAVSPAIYAAEDCTGNDCMPKEIKNSCTVETVSGCIDWENGIVYSVGMGVPNDKLTSAAQKRYSAYQAARVVAQRNLLQMIEEVQIDSTQTVKMGMLENDEINLQIHGTVKNVSEVGKPKVASDGSTFVTMQMHLRDIMSILAKNEHFELMDKEIPKTLSPAPSAPATNAPAYGGDAKTVYSGLIIDAKGLGVKPAMSPKVFNADGTEIYGSAQVDRDFALQYGIAGYVKDLAQGKGNERVKGNPLVIKAEPAGGNKGSDLKISNQDAELLKQLEQTQAFLREGRVLIVL